MNELHFNGEFVQSVQRGVKEEKHLMCSLPGLIVVMIRDGIWKDRIVPLTGERATFEDFEEFVTAPPLQGLGVTMDILKKVCRGEMEALDMIDRAMQGRQGERTDLFDNVKEVKAPTGNSTDAALRRLRKDAPELHQRVLSGELSPNAAMVEAGFRKKMLTLPKEPEKAAEAIRRHFTEEERKKIKDLL